MTADRPKPKSIQLFNRLNLAATILVIANILVHYRALRGLAIANGSSPAGPFLGLLYFLLSYVIFWFFIVRRGSRIAKWVFVALTAIAIAMIPRSLDQVIALGIPYTVVDGASFVLQLAAAAMLFRSDAKFWLEHRNIAPAAIVER